MTLVSARISILNFLAQADINKDTREIINIFKELKIISYGKIIPLFVLIMLPGLRKLALSTCTESCHSRWLVVFGDFSRWSQLEFTFCPYLEPVFPALFNGTSAISSHTQPLSPFTMELMEKAFAEVYQHLSATPSLSGLVQPWPWHCHFSVTQCFLSQPICWETSFLLIQKSPAHLQILPVLA